MMQAPVSQPDGLLRQSEPYRKGIRLIRFADNAILAGRLADAEMLIRLAYHQFDLAPLAQYWHNRVSRGHRCPDTRPGVGERPAEGPQTGLRPHCTEAL